MLVCQTTCKYDKHRSTFHFFITILFSHIFFLTYGLDHMFHNVFSSHSSVHHFLLYIFFSLIYILVFFSHFFSHLLFSHFFHMYIIFVFQLFFHMYNSFFSCTLFNFFFSFILVHIHFFFNQNIRLLRSIPVWREVVKVVNDYNLKSNLAEVWPRMPLGMVGKSQVKLDKNYLQLDNFSQCANLDNIHGFVQDCGNECTEVAV